MPFASSDSSTVCTGGNFRKTGSVSTSTLLRAEIGQVHADFARDARTEPDAGNRHFERDFVRHDLDRGIAGVSMRPASAGASGGRRD